MSVLKRGATANRYRRELICRTRKPGRDLLAVEDGGRGRGRKRPAGRATVAAIIRRHAGRTERDRQRN